MTRLIDSWVMNVSPAQMTGVSLRPIRPDDAELIHQMHQRLSPESLYFRYLQYRAPTLDEIAAVCAMEPTLGTGFVATVPQTQGDQKLSQNQEVIVGVAYYARESSEQPQIVEPGILVEDRFQGKGIGRTLWQRLQQQAKTEHVRWLRVLFHPGNSRVLRLLQSGGLAYEATYNGGLNEYLVALGEQHDPSFLQRILHRFGLVHLGKDDMSPVDSA